MLFALSFVALWALNVFWGGFVAATLWGWFAVPLGVPAITFWHAAGLSALLSVFLGARGLPAADKSDAGALQLLAFVYSVLIPLLSLAAGWVAHANM